MSLINKNEITIELCEFIIDFFNIKSTNKILDISIFQMSSEIIENGNPSDYIKFIKSNLKNQKYQFLTNIQKFEIMSQDFLSNFAKLKNEDLYKCDIFAENARKKIFYFFDEVNFELQIRNRKIENLKIDNYFSKVELKIINQIGGKIRVFNLNNCNKQLLSDLIINTVINLKKEKMKKEYLIQNKKNEFNLIEKLKGN